METETDKYYRRTFNSIYELTEYVSMHKDMVNSGDFAKYMDADMSFDETLKVGKQGGYWPTGAKQIKPVNLSIGELNVHGLDLPRLEPAIVGFRPNVAAYLCGSPYSMFKMSPFEQPNRLIKIAVNVTKSGSIGQAESFIRGNAILSVINSLASYGIAIELWAVLATGDKGKEAQIATLIKSSESQYSADSIAFALVNDAFFRRLAFSAIHIAHVKSDTPQKFADIKSIGWGTGTKATYNDYDIVFPWFQAGDRWTESGAVEKAKKILEAGLKTWGQLK